MIQKLRRKFVAICMLMVTAVLAVVFCSIYYSVQQNIVSLSQQVLHQVVRENNRGGMARPDVSITIGGDRVLLPYFTVDIWGGTAYVTGGTYADLEDTDALRSILSDCLAQNADSGVISNYHLRYLRQNNGLYQKLAFVDMSMEQAMLRRMAVSYLRIVLVTLVLLLAVSILLSRWAIRPVEKAWQQQRQFLSDASHELKTPLTVILSNAELLEAAPLEERPARWADNIHAEARQMRTLVEEMLTLARADQMTTSAVHSELSLSDLVTDCALAFEPVAFEAGKPLTYDIAEGIAVTGDGDKLRRLVSVLLDNAIKYSRQGGFVQIDLTAEENEVVLTVADNGIGIPEEDISHIFERFYRVDKARSRSAGGTGLGLSIVHDIVRKRSGSITAAHRQGGGTVFTVRLPRAKGGAGE